MDYLSGLISSRFNCTVPWLLHHVRLSFIFSLSNWTCAIVHALLSVSIKLLYWKFENFRGIFRFRKLNIPVCGSNVSAFANQLYLKNQVNNKQFMDILLSSLNHIRCIVQGCYIRNGISIKGEIWKNYDTCL